jgi:hypothetical protein
VWQVSEPRTYLFNPKALNNLAMASGHGLINFYDFATGAFVYTMETGQREENSIREIVYDEQAVYFGDAKGSFYSYSLPGAQNDHPAGLRWKIETKGGIESIPAFYQNEVLVINNGKQLLRIDKSNGDVKQDIKIKGEALISGVTVDKDQIFYSCYGGIVVKFTL